MKKIQGGHIVNKKSVRVTGFWMTLILMFKVLGVTEVINIHNVSWAVVLPIGIVGISLQIFSNFMAEKRP
ncbi:hypothetical protein [Oceanobacillus jeddahense]|uniref:Uncharacterized protein n=1 Tax=Oceanobacillus jeddahense TaxID=1462527 RepID=A0ABY5JX20_9BACI|nr:hypothetical protein [Oceanobacillus jeddahense]UUI04938.1 hypothetical protein NP439_10000 [Oceanobacillus jeddahense]